ncbi:Uncharacterised protein [Mycobacteroides abscessus]|nr:Uncharacterised protein [Mycobacteroides abscessus]
MVSTHEEHRVVHAGPHQHGHHQSGGHRGHRNQPALGEPGDNPAGDEQTHSHHQQGQHRGEPRPEHQQQNQPDNYHGHRADLGKVAQRSVAHIGHGPGRTGDVRRGGRTGEGLLHQVIHGAKCPLRQWSTEVAGQACHRIPGGAVLAENLLTRHRIAAHSRVAQLVLDKSDVLRVPPQPLDQRRISSLRIGVKPLVTVHHDDDGIVDSGAAEGLSHLLHRGQRGTHLTRRQRADRMLIGHPLQLRPGGVDQDADREPGQHHQFGVLGHEATCPFERRTVLVRHPRLLRSTAGR